MISAKDAPVSMVIVRENVKMVNNNLCILFNSSSLLFKVLVIRVNTAVPLPPQITVRMSGTGNLPRDDRKSGTFPEIPEIICRAG